MTTPSKPREFWLLKDAIDAEKTDILSHEPTRHTISDFIHVVDKSAFNKAVAALQWIANESDLQHCIDEAKETLREIGVEL